MDITKLQGTPGNLILPMQNEAELSRLLDTSRHAGNQIGVVSKRFPLLATLTLEDNITLPAQYNRNIPPEQMLSILSPALKALDIAQHLPSLPAQVHSQDKFRTIILRTISQGASTLVMPSPTQPEVEDALAVAQALEGEIRIWVACLSKDAAQFDPFNLQSVRL